MLKRVTGLAKCKTCEYSTPILLGGLNITQDPMKCPVCGAPLTLERDGE